MDPTHQKIGTWSDLEAKTKKWKSEGDCIVFTNGCFDLLHLGHIDYLEEARRLGDRLVIGLNSDASVRMIKGPDRPIFGGEARARHLAALQFVDAVTFFDQRTPAELIALLLPDILVKGSDYKPENIAGSNVVIENGGSVQTIPLLEGYSTTGLISKIKETSI